MQNFISFLMVLIFFENFEKLFRAYSNSELCALGVRYSELQVSLILYQPPLLLTSPFICISHYFFQFTLNSSAFSMGLVAWDRDNSVSEVKSRLNLKLIGLLI